MTDMQSLIDKAGVLTEALPYIRAFYGKTVVIKYGGAAMVDDTLKQDFASDVVLLKYIGINPVVVHGGGPQIGQTLKKLGRESVFVDGLRVTDPFTMEVVEMVLTGKINQEIVAMINQMGGAAVGLSGKDGALIRARKLDRSSTNQADLGLVGEVEEIVPDILHNLDSSRFIPVIAPVGVDASGQTLNINADLVAARLAAALKAAKLVYLSDVSGVNDDDGRLVSSLAAGRVQEMIKKGTIAGGMIPKVEYCLEALAQGVGKTHIIDGRVKHAILLEIFTDKGIGTEIKAD
jgi:acetylglutamate kinase